MVPVRKPGRPLSVCPHPPNKLCGCGGVTAALPRSQKCGCGSNPTIAAAGQSTAESPSIKPQGSPTRRAFHVHKPGTKSVSRIEPAGLERTDINNLNIHPPPSWATASVPYLNGGFALPMPPPPAGASFQPVVPNGYHHQGGVDFDRTYITASMPLPPARAVLETVAPPSNANGSPVSAGATTSSCCAPASPRP